MTEYVTDWGSIETLHDAKSAITGGRLDLQKWVVEPIAICKWMAEFLSPQASVLDLGCGIGRVTPYLTSHFSVAACDPFVNLLDLGPFAQEKIPICSYGDIFYCSGVLSCYVMQHLPKRDLTNHLRYLEECSWDFLFLLEADNPSDFSDFDFHDPFEEWSQQLDLELIDSREWAFEPGVTAKVYKRG